MEYTKPSLSFEAQADLLMERGLDASKERIVEKLRAVNYYRLSGYWYPFCDCEHLFAEGTSLDMIWRRYTFDRHLRLLVMDAIERVEISVRTCMTEKFTQAHGPFGHLGRDGFSDGFDIVERGRFAGNIRVIAKKSKEAFVKHFAGRYGDKHADLPLWMAVETMTFGSMFTMFRYLKQHHQRSIANEFGLKATVLESWLHSLNYIRNVCAHHGRLWNRQLAVSPKIPHIKNSPEFHDPVSIKSTSKRMFCILTILKYMMDMIAPQSRWNKRFRSLLQEYPDIPLEEMRFPDNWESCSIWAPHHH
jgi:abortive infection bacteriophage resistance protein